MLSSIYIWAHMMKIVSTAHRIQAKINELQDQGDPRMVHERLALYVCDGGESPPVIQETPGSQAAGAGAGALIGRADGPHVKAAPPLLTVEAAIYLSSYETTTIWHMKDIMEGVKTVSQLLILLSIGC